MSANPHDKPVYAEVSDDWAQFLRSHPRIEVVHLRTVDWDPDMGTQEIKFYILDEDGGRLPKGWEIRCKNCGEMLGAFDEDNLLEEWGDGKTQLEVNQELIASGEDRVYCSRGCMAAKLGL